MKHLLLRWLLPLLLLNLTGAAWAATPPGTGPAAATPSLAAALNPDGTLKAGATGSFDARAFRMRTAPDGRPVFRPASTKGAGDERWADGFGLPNGTDGNVYAVVRSGTDMYIGGGFTAVGNVAANGVAKWNGTAWSPLGAGVNNNVYTLAVAGNGDVYAGGMFTQAGGAAANYVARWNGTAWSPLGAGVVVINSNAGVNALAVASNGDVYVGGFINQAGGAAVNYVAKWNGTAWSPLGTGVSGNVTAVAVAGNGDVYVGGRFSQAGGAAANNVAKWNGTAWSPLGAGTANGVNSNVDALVVAGNGDVYAGGLFTQAGGVAANYVARWNGTTWSPLGAGVSSGVRALAVAGNGDVYVGGGFSQAGGAAANCVAKWNGTSWSPLGAGISYPGGNYVYALAVAGNGDVYVGGFINQAGGAAVNYVAKWNGTAWSPLGAGTANGLNSYVSALTVAGNGDVYAGGGFMQAGGAAANYVAKWNGTAWSPLGAGVSSGVNAVAVAGNGDVYVGGGFTQAGGAAANYVAKWNGTAWSSLGAGTANGMNSYVGVLVVAGNGDVYAGGLFTQAGGVAANGVAKWNGTTWSPLGTGVGGGVYALAVAVNGDVYAGGGFTQAGGGAANYVAKWDGTAWSPLGAGTSGNVSAVAVAGNGDVYVGGRFSQAGGAAANNVAKWNGTAWSPLGAGTNGFAPVNALVVAGNGDVYVGGGFSQAGGVAANGVAKWNGTAWSPLGTSVNGQVLRLARDASGKLYAGGYFTTTGDGSKVMARFATYDPNAPLASTAATRAAPAALFPNPAHGAATLRLPATAPRQPLTLHDALGRVVRRYPAPAGPDAVLDLRGLPAGTYVVRCGALSQRLVVE